MIPQRNHLASLQVAALLLASTSLLRVSAENPVIVDLAENFAYADSFNNSPGATAVNELAASIPILRSVLVLEHGKIVAEYSRADVDASIPYPVYSTTKSWMSLLFGLMIENGLVSLDETLGDIFGNDPDVWNTVPNATQRQAIALEQMLTMTAGFSDSLPSNDTEVDFGNGGNLGGASLVDSLSNPQFDADSVGSFQYLAANNILSYVVQERANATPGDYLAQEVLPYLGMDSADFAWWQNEDRVEYASFGMLLTSQQMAKWGQLYLQEGRSNNTHQLIDEKWVHDSTSVQAGVDFYGYLIWVWTGVLIGMPTIDRVYCSMGLGGQDVCVSPQMERVFVQQRDLSNEASPNPVVSLGIISAVLDPETVFTNDINKPLASDLVEADDSPGIASRGTTTFSIFFLLALVFSFVQTYC